MSHSCRSKPGTPSTSHSATARPIPAEWVTQTASANQKPFTSRDSPSSGMLSVVNENSPFIPSAISVLRSPGISRWDSSQAGSKSSGVNRSTDGITSASSYRRISSAVVGSGRWPYQPMPTVSRRSR